MKYIQGAMALVYILLGLAVLWKSDTLFNLKSGYAVPLGLVLIAYGLIRGFRAYQRNS